jgi:MraZ protein
MPYIYSGQGFSLQRDKNRFVLPAAFRSTLKESSGGPVVCLGKSDELKCIIGFGVSRKAEMIEQYDIEERMALERGVPFNSVQRGMALFGFHEVPFDDSGRFILPDPVATSASIGDELYFHGAGRFFTAWNPAELAKMDAGWEGAQAICESLAAKERAKAKRK